MLKKYALKKSILLCFGSLMFFWPTSQPMFSKVYSLSHELVQKALDKIDAQTLVVFDIDETMVSDFDAGRDVFNRIHLKNKKLEIQDLIFLHQAEQKFSSYMEDKRAKNFPIDDFIRSSCIDKSNDKLIEPDLLIDFITQAQKKGAKIMALSAVPAGRLGTIDSVCKRRYEKLKERGIDFSRSFEQESIVLDTLQLDHGSHPICYKGICCSGINNKGSTIIALLDKLDWKPSKVLFFDDQKLHCNGVVQAMSGNTIDYHVFWYCAAEKIPLTQFDRNIAQVQLDYLVEKDEYILPKEAEAIIKKTTHDLEPECQ